MNPATSTRTHGEDLGGQQPGQHPAGDLHPGTAEQPDPDGGDQGALPPRRVQPGPPGDHRCGDRAEQAVQAQVDRPVGHQRHTLRRDTGDAAQAPGDERGLRPGGPDVLGQGRVPDHPDPEDQADGDEEQRGGGQAEGEHGHRRATDHGHRCGGGDPEAIMIAVGAGALAASIGAYDSGTEHSTLMDNPAGRFFGAQGDWLWPVIAAAAAILALLAVRWLLTLLFSTDRAGDLRSTRPAPRAGPYSPPGHLPKP